MTNQGIRDSWFCGNFWWDFSDVLGLVVLPTNVPVIGSDQDNVGKSC